MMGVSSNTFRGRMSDSSPHVLPQPWARIILVTGNAATHSPLPGGANLEAGARNHEIRSAPVAVYKGSLRNGMTLTLREAMDNDVVARRKRSNRHARKAGSIFGGRVGSRSATAQTARWARHRPQVPTAIVRLLVNPLGHRGLWSLPRSLTPADYRLNVTTDYFVFGQLMLRITA